MKLNKDFFLSTVNGPARLLNGQLKGTPFRSGRASLRILCIPYSKNCLIFPSNSEMW